jgi:phage terminase small subunit
MTKQGKGLTPKQDAFVREYLIDLNATQAAIRAGYSAKTAKQQGQRLLTNVDVAEAVQAGKASREERLGIDADLADLYGDDGSLRPVKDWPDIWRKGLVAGVDVEEIRADGAVIGTVRKIKLSDRIKRLELIGKHVSVQAFKEQVEHKGGINLTVSQDDAEL